MLGSPTGTRLHPNPAWPCTLATFRSKDIGTTHPPHTSLCRIPAERRQVASSAVLPDRRHQPHHSNRLSRPPSQRNRQSRSYHRCPRRRQPMYRRHQLKLNRSRQLRRPVHLVDRSSSRSNRMRHRSLRPHQPRVPFAPGKEEVSSFVFPQVPQSVARTHPS
jgi:hypothetical protein